ncbi:MAG: TetR/AcrR family transcriptional regulator [Chloroflexota bacterium]|nr:TetR/AcrR family transcriptional regulator [Chloroflexota bacterium]
MERVEKPISVLSPQERRQRNREEMQGAILEAARQVMREQGVAALSLREVARRVKIQAPSLYAYYPSKTALYDALFLEGIRTYVSFRNSITAGHTSFWDIVHTWVETYMRFAQEHPELYQLCFERPVPGFVPSEASMEASRRLLAGSEEILAQALANGEIRLDLPNDQARDLIIAMMHGLTSQHMANEPNLPVGSGRYGRLVPAAVALFRAAWEPGQPTTPGPDSPSHQDSGDSAGKEVGD